MKNDDNPRLRITVDPAVMGGNPCIREMRVTVAAVAALLEEMDDWQILNDYPYLEQEDLDAVREYQESQ